MKPKLPHRKDHPEEGSYRLEYAARILRTKAEDLLSEVNSGTVLAYILDGEVFILTQEVLRLTSSPKQWMNTFSPSPVIAPSPKASKAAQAPRSGVKLTSEQVAKIASCVTPNEVCLMIKAVNGLTELRFFDSLLMGLESDQIEQRLELRASTVKGYFARLGRRICGINSARPELNLARKNGEWVQDSSLKKIAISVFSSEEVRCKAIVATRKTIEAKMRDIIPADDEGSELIDYGRFPEAKEMMTP